MLGTESYTSTPSRRSRTRGFRSILFAALVSVGLQASAQDSGFGLGIMIGEPTGLSAKAWVGGDRALAFGLAWGPWHGGYLHLHGDYLFHNYDLIKVNKGKLPLYYGPGLRMRSWTGGRYWHHGRFHDHAGTYTDLSVRFPVGLAYQFDGAPVDVFLEVVPTLRILPGTSFDGDGALGVRYWF